MLDRDLDVFRSERAGIVFEWLEHGAGRMRSPGLDHRHAFSLVGEECSLVPMSYRAIGVHVPDR